MDKLEKNLSFNEICLIAVDRSTVKSRRHTLPVITMPGNKVKQRVFISPMTCLLDETNYDKVMTDSQFIPIYPVRYDNLEIRKKRMENGDWIAMSTEELQELMKTTSPSGQASWRICLDTAQGQREDLYNIIYEFKKLFPHTELMVGNIMTAGAYIECAMAGADYVRCSVGTGAGCITSVLTGFHRSMPRILNEINLARQEIEKMDDGSDRWIYKKSSLEARILKTVPAVIADGGLGSIDKIIKAYALGADYVMIGSLFARTDAASGELIPGPFKDNRVYYGQASEHGQLDRFGSIRYEPEGIEKKLIIDWKFDRLQEKLESVLRSAMSYAGAHEMNEFIGGVHFEEQSLAEFNSYNK